jgi:hypothetical protein
MTRLITRLTTATAASGLLLFTLAACPGSEGGTAGGTCANYVNALVSYLDRCGEGSSPAIASTRARFEDACARAIAAPGATNLAGQIESCTQSVATISCGEDFDCVATTGTLDDGAPCAEGYQCKGGACNVAPEASCGTCTQRVAIGGDCTTSSKCVEGSSCLIGNGGAGKCVPIKIAKAGENCIARSGGEIIRCDKGLSCSVVGTEATCRAPGVAGDACRSRGDCSENLRCVKDKCAAPLGEGADCQANECAKGLQCDSSTKKCARIVYAKAGEACDTLRRCERGECEGMTFDGAERKPGKCVAPLPDGAACTKGEGPPCDTFAQCIAGKCTPTDPGQCK